MKLNLFGTFGNNTFYNIVGCKTVCEIGRQMGVLFNPNKELMRSHNAENRFQLYYYSHGEFRVDERKETILTIDTR